MRINSLLHEFETDLGDGGDGGAPPEPITPAEAPEAPAAEAVAPEAPEAPAAPEPQYLTREQAEALLAERDQALYELAIQNQPRNEQPYEEPINLAELDPLDPDFAQQFARYQEQREQRLLQALDQRLSGLDPVVESHHEQASQQWLDQTYGRLQVPDADHWKEGVLYASAAFVPRDEYGRAVGSPQVHAQAVQQSYEFMQRFAQAEREAAITEYKAQQDTEQERLRNLAGAPSTPAGGGGGVHDTSALAEGETELDVARRWRERQRAAGAL